MSEKDNLLNPDLLKLFRNLKHVKIYPDYSLVLNKFNLLSYKFNLLSFLDVIESNSRDIQYQIRLYDVYGWDITTSIVSAYNRKQWNIKYERNADHGNIIIDNTSIF